MKKLLTLASALALSVGLSGLSACSKSSSDDKPAATQPAPKPAAPAAKKDGIDFKAGVSLDSDKGADGKVNVDINASSDD